MRTIRMEMRKFNVDEHERGLLFRDNKFQVILDPGRHWFHDPLWKITVERVSVRNVRLLHNDLEAIVKSGALLDQAKVLNLNESERALVWIDGQFKYILDTGVHVLWTVFHNVRVEIVGTTKVRFVRERREHTMCSRN